MKVFKIIVISIVTLILLTVGGLYMRQEMERQYILEVAKSEEVKQLVEEELHDLDDNALTAEGKITSYEILYDKSHTTPMGGMFIYVILNDNPEYDISLGLDKDFDTNKLKVISIVTSQKVSAIAGRK